MSPLQTLAPDQRAVLELLLRQGRSYAELSELLGLPEHAVRDRAHAALAALAPDRVAPIGEDGAVADWILGQADPAEASRTRDAIARMPAWRAWAAEVTDRLNEVDGATVPDVPGAEEADAAPAPAAKQPSPRAARKGSSRSARRSSPRTAENESPPPSQKGSPRTAGNASPTATGSRPRPLRAGGAAAGGAAAGGAATGGAATGGAAAGGAAGGAAAGASPRRPDRRGPREPAVAAASGGGGAAAALRSSRVGGAILIGVLILLVGGFLFWFLSRGSGNDNPPSAQTTPTATPTATPQVVVEVPLTGVGTKSAGLMRVFKRDDGKLVFALAADKMPANKAREVYAVWFTKKGGAPRNLGFAQTQVGKDGVFTTGGPQQGQETAFAGWLSSYDTVIVARAAATSAAAKQPGQVVLRGTLPGGK